MNTSAANAAAIGVIRNHRNQARRHSIIVTCCLIASTMIAFCLSISVGDFPIPLRDIVPGVLGFGDSDTDFIIRTLRLPRALAAVLVGSAFGLSGAILQSVANNPLASPDLIGITAGASAAAVFVIIVLNGGTALVAGGALIGAVTTAAGIYLLAYRRGASSYRFILIGIGVDAMLTAVVSFLFTRASVVDVNRALVWLTGSLNGRSWDHVRPLAIAMAVLVPLVAISAPSLRALQLGDAAARGLGLSVEIDRAALVLASVLLAAVGTAAAGPVAFVAFIAPPVARRLVGSPVALLASAVCGSLLLLAADLVARRLFAPVELPVGVVTGVIGAPYLLWLLVRANRVGAGR